jgi:hypothetical protein
MFHPGGCCQKPKKYARQVFRKKYAKIRCQQGANGKHLFLRPPPPRPIRSFTFPPILRDFFGLYKIFPRAIDIISIQPMNDPVGLVFKIEFAKEKKRYEFRRKNKRD